MCLYPRLVKNPKYTATKKNGGIIPAVNDNRVLYVPIGCTNCIECRKQKAREWQTRLMEDIKSNKNGKFVTLTFNTESLIKLANQHPQIKGYTLDNAIATTAVKLFRERWRKKYKKSLRHWLVTELGHQDTQHIHLHGILWMNDITLLDDYWKYGFTWKGTRIDYKGKIIYENYVNEKTVNYITKYVTKMDVLHQTYKPIILTSPGIGANYKHHNKQQEYYRTNTGHKIKLPIYWRNKTYTEEEKEKLWLQQLDKQTRYVCGEKIDVSQNHDQYFNVLEHHRQRNKQLGYGNDKINWNRKKYEHELRELIHTKRIHPSAAGRPG